MEEGYWQVVPFQEEEEVVPFQEVEEAYQLGEVEYHLVEEAEYLLKELPLEGEAEVVECHLGEEEEFPLVEVVVHLKEAFQEEEERQQAASQVEEERQQAACLEAAEFLQNQEVVAAEVECSKELALQVSIDFLRCSLFLQQYHLLLISFPHCANLVIQSCHPDSKTPTLHKDALQILWSQSHKEV